MSAPVYLYPQPRSYRLTGGSSPAAAGFDVRAAGEEAALLAEEADVAGRLEASLRAAEAASGEPRGRRPARAAAVVEYLAELHPQGYVLKWDADGLGLKASTAQGLHYALLTAAQFFEGLSGSAEWPHCRIDDEPDFAVRGVMLDIGRNKIPKMETLYALVDRLSELKFNHLQLYMEGFCFDYAKYAALFPEATPITAAEYRELDAYAAARYIDLVPNQNCLGHMGPWLAKPEFRDLAEHPDGMPTPLPFKLPPVTLNPADERSAALAKDLFDELLPCFSSRYVNLNMDEPFGLGTGGSKARAEEIGVAGLYMEYAERMFRIARSHGKKPLLWGDVLARHPELIERLPDDATVLHWNYDEPVPYEPACRTLSEKGVPYYVCPGTSSWSSLSGRTDNMLGNVADAARNGLAYGAGGLIITDWGDSGHWQAPAVSFPGFAYAAGASWRAAANLDRLEPLEHHVSRRMLQDRTGRAARLLLEMGRYYHLERCTIENGTYTSYLLNRGLSSREDLERDTSRLPDIARLLGGAGTPFRLDYRYAEMEEWLRERREELDGLALTGPDAAIVKDEIANTLLLIEAGAGLHRYIYRQDLPDEEAEAEWLGRLRTRLEAAVREFRRLWLARNREGGLDASAAAFDRLLGQYGGRLRELKRG